MDRYERDQLAHLASDWEAQAAAIEREGLGMMHDDCRSRLLREHAGQLRDRLLALRAPVPRSG